MGICFVRQVETTRVFEKGLIVPDPPSGFSTQLAEYNLGQALDVLRAPGSEAFESGLNTET